MVDKKKYRSEELQVTFSRVYRGYVIRVSKGNNYVELPLKIGDLEPEGSDYNIDYKELLNGLIEAVEVL